MDEVSTQPDVTQASEMQISKGPTWWLREEIKNLKNKKFSLIQAKLININLFELNLIKLD